MYEEPNIDEYTSTKLWFTFNVGWELLGIFSPRNIMSIEFFRFLGFSKQTETYTRDRIESYETEN